MTDLNLCEIITLVVINTDIPDNYPPLYPKCKEVIALYLCTYVHSVCSSVWNLEMWPWKPTKFLQLLFGGETFSCTVTVVCSIKKKTAFHLKATNVPVVHTIVHLGYHLYLWQMVKWVFIWMFWDIQEVDLNRGGPKYASCVQGITRSLDGLWKDFLDKVQHSIGSHC